MKTLYFCEYIFGSNEIKINTIDDVRYSVKYGIVAPKKNFNHYINFNSPNSCKIFELDEVQIIGTEGAINHTYIYTMNKYFSYMKLIEPVLIDKKNSYDKIFTEYQQVREIYDKYLKMKMI